MSEPAYVSTVRIAPGRGRVVVRADGLVFLPAVPEPTEPGDELAGATIDAAVDAPPGELLPRLADHVVDNDLAVPALVAVDWSGDRPRVMAFGDASLRTDHRGLPGLSGSGSATYVEHVLRARPSRLVLASGDAAVLRDTRVVAGVVPAAAVEVELASPEDEPAGQRSVEPVTGQHEETLAAVKLQREGGGEDRPPDAGPPPPPPQPAELPAAPVLDPAVHAGAAFVLLLDDGRQVPVDRPLLIGRDPQPYEGRTGVAVVDETVSAEHLELDVVEGELVAIDLGTTNGSYLLTPGEEEVRLADYAATAVPVGATVHVGVRRFEVAAAGTLTG